MRWGFLGSYATDIVRGAGARSMSGTIVVAIEGVEEGVLHERGERISPSCEDNVDERLVGSGSWAIEGWWCTRDRFEALDDAHWRTASGTQVGITLTVVVEGLGWRGLGGGDAEHGA